VSGWAVGLSAETDAAFGAPFAGRLTRGVGALVVFFGARRRRRSAGGCRQRLQAGERGCRLFCPRPVAREAQDPPAGVAGDPSGLVKQAVAESLEFPGARVLREQQPLAPGEEVDRPSLRGPRPPVRSARVRASGFEVIVRISRTLFGPRTTRFPVNVGFVRLRAHVRRIPCNQAVLGRSPRSPVSAEKG
jgi:hypothetical protein